MITYDLVPWQGALPARIGAEWDYLTALDTATPLFNYREWLTLAEPCAPRAPRALLIIRQGAEPIALLPLQKKSPWTWGLLSWFGQADQQLLLDPAREANAWTGVARWLRATPIVAQLSLGATCHAQRIDHFRQACDDVGLTCLVTAHEKPVVLSTVPESWEVFLASLGPRMRKDIRQAERALERDFPDLTVDFLSDPSACHAALDELITLHRQRWGDSLGGCIFDKASHCVQYHLALEWALRRGWATISAVRAGGHTLATQALFHIPGQQALYAQFIARDTERLPKRYSPGIVLMSHMLRWAMAREVSQVNLGAGAGAYKLVFNGEPLPRWKLAMARSPLGATVAHTINRGLYLAQRTPRYTTFYAQRLLDGIAHRYDGMAPGGEEPGYAGVGE
ncbi:MAG TPA: GNAT family N-acetyltransferase [Armatimonadota bacterium]